MKPLTLLLPGILLLVLAACSKNADPAPPKRINNNKLTATVTVKGRSPRAFIATGADSTYFLRRLEGTDTLYSLQGADGIGGITLHIFGVLSPGTYPFLPGDTLGTNVPFLDYLESDFINPTLVASTIGTDSAGNALASGSFTIISMTDNEVEGTMEAQIGDGDSLRVEVESGYFKGTYER